MSMQLDPDIEFKMAPNKQTKASAKTNNIEKSKSSTVVVDLEEEEAGNLEEYNEESSEKSLYLLFQEYAVSENKFCEKEFSQKVIFVAS